MFFFVRVLTFPLYAVFQIPDTGKYSTQFFGSIPFPRGNDRYFLVKTNV